MAQLTITMHRLAPVTIDGRLSDQYAIYLGWVRVAKLNPETTEEELGQIRALLTRVGNAPEIRIRCGECGSWQCGGSLASGLKCYGDTVDDDYGEKTICGHPKELGEDAPARVWHVVRTAFHGGGTLSSHRTLGGAIRACRAKRIGDCQCGCAGVVDETEYAGLESQDEHRSRNGSPYNLTR